MLNTKQFAFSSFEQPIRVLQISDMHVFSDQAQTLLGIPTWDSFQAVVAYLASQKRSFDMVLVTGDISQDKTVASYQSVMQALEVLEVPVHMIPGNHDDLTKMQQAMPQLQLEHYVRLDLGAWHVHCLDSTLKGEVKGKISDALLQRLITAIAAAPQHFHLVVLHHNALPVGSAWLDAHQLQGGDAFLEALVAYPQVKIVLCGHVHQEKTLHYQHLDVLMSPATSVQFKPQHDEFFVDTAQPGWRLMTLNPHGDYHTSVVRLPGHQFVPQQDDKGYD